MITATTMKNHRNKNTNYLARDAVTKQVGNVDFMYIGSLNARMSNESHHF